MDSTDKHFEIWRYPRFFSDNLTLSDDDLNHAERVLRLKRGDFAVICDGGGNDCLCEYRGNNAFELVEKMPNTAEPDLAVTLYQCLPKSDKFDYIVQKAVELGVTRIVPLVSKRCVSRPDVKSAQSKVKRWNKIAYEAAKQCGRGKVPTVGELLTFEQAVLQKNAEINIIFYECGGKPLNGLVSPNMRSLGVFIGSEGGFEQSEVSLAAENGISPATLGKRVLRVDTASVAALAVIMNITGNI